MEREYFSIPEAAAMLGISRIAVFKRVKKGQLKALRFGRNWAVPASALKTTPPPSTVHPGPPPPPQKNEAPRQRPSSDDEMNSMGWD
ncbi:MAG TPA: hypothetical protein DCS63_04155 [Elusimicrobia bacterium]|nr:hypothetical protein [Elusimicrobiota bacterium]